VKIKAPLKSEFHTNANTQSFLNASLLTIIIYLGMLSTMLLYSLMLSDVDGKTYEYGMLRALGFKKSYLTSLILMTSFAFSVPGILFGVIVAAILNTGLRELIFNLSENSMPYNLTKISIIIGVTFGIVMPIISNYLPIKRAMGKNLRNSLDLSRRTTDEIGIKVERLENIGMSFNQVAVGILLIVIGFGTYYLVPYALFKGKTTIVFVLLNVLLIFIIVGMTFICVMLFAPLERFCLWVLMNTCCRRDKRIHSVINKNMDSHRNRNQKTSIMFTMTLSFLIFSASSFQMMANLILQTVESSVGADVFAQASSMSALLNEGGISGFLD